MSGFEPVPECCRSKQAGVLQYTNLATHPSLARIGVISYVAIAVHEIAGCMMLNNEHAGGQQGQDEPVDLSRDHDSSLQVPPPRRPSTLTHRFKDRRYNLSGIHDKFWYFYLKGSLTRDFLLLVFFLNHFPPNL
jgi:hypothetical protein